MYNPLYYLTSQGFFVAHLKIYILKQKKSTFQSSPMLIDGSNIIPTVIFEEKLSPYPFIKPPVKLQQTGIHIAASPYFATKLCTQLLTMC